MRLKSWALSFSLCLVQPAFAGDEPIRLGLIEGFSGPAANAGEAVARNITWAVERVNKRGGVKLADGRHPLQLVRLDSKGSSEEALSLLRSALDQHIGVVM